MAQSPARYRDRVLSYSVYSDGVKVNDRYCLTSVNIRQGLNRIGKATLKFNAGDMEAQTFAETDDDFFKPGREVRLDVGDVVREQTVFEGMVVQLRIEADGETRTQMVVECRDVAFRATLGRKNRFFEGRKDSDIIADVLGQYGVVTVDATVCCHRSLVQYYCTDWDFVLSRAEANGLFVVVRGKEFCVGRPEPDGPAVLTVNYGSDLIDFNGGISMTDQFEAVEAVSWDPVRQQAVTFAAAAPRLNTQGDLSPSDVAGGERQLWQADVPMAEEALQSLVDGVALVNGLARYEGSFMFYGCADVVPGCTIELTGMGKRFNGNVYVGQVEHVIENNIWTTRAYMGVDSKRITEEADVVAPPATGWVPGIEGLHIGKVKKLEGDPQKEYRILIELPWFNGEKKECWARWATGYTGSCSGFFFLPEPGNEVVVGFFNNDPGHPVVLGGMYSPKLAPAYPLETKNAKKAIVGREKMTIEFDEEKKRVVITTPGENRLEISDDSGSVVLTDQNKNKLLLNEEGILLESSKDIVLKARGNILLDAAAKFSAKSQTDGELSAANVKITARTGLVAKGNATAELSASGQTTIKGAMVMIN